MMSWSSSSDTSPPSERSTAPSYATLICPSPFASNTLNAISNSASSASWTVRGVVAKFPDFVLLDDDFMLANREMKFWPELAFSNFLVSASIDLLVCNFFDFPKLAILIISKKFSHQKKTNTTEQQ
jgi:hypothetical protein